MHHNRDFVICNFILIRAKLNRNLYLNNYFSQNCSISESDVQAAGRVYVYKYPSKKQLISLTGQDEFEQFGYDFDLSIQLNRKVIAVSSYTKSKNLKHILISLIIDF